MPLDKPTHDRVIDAIVPHVATESEQQKLVYSAFVEAPKLKDEIRFGKAARPFSEALVTQCVAHGDIRDLPALCLLLREVKTFVGIDKQAELDALMQAVIEQSAPTPDTTTDTATLPDIAADEVERIKAALTAPRLMISYARRDMHAFRVTAMAERLQRQHYYDVWIDYNSIPAGKPWRDEISRGIQSAARVLFLMTPASVQSAYCKAEIRHALQHGIEVIPLQLSKDCTLNDLKMPEFNQDIHYLRFADEDFEQMWGKLIQLLPAPPTGKRDFELFNDPALKDLHTRYLRSIFARLGDVHIPNFSRERVRLTDVYVPLFLGIRIWGEIKNNQMVDWWIEEFNAVNEPISIDESNSNEKRPKTLRQAQVDPKLMRLIIDRMHRFLEKIVAKRDDDIQDGNYSLWRLESEEAPALMQHLVITGDPGSGKSTLIKHIALCMAGDMLGDETANIGRLGFWPHPAFTPIFIELRGLVRSMFPKTDDPVTLQHVYTYLEREQLVPYDVQAYLDPLKRQLSQGEAIVFLDGLDEVPNGDEESRREQIKTLVHELHRAFPNVHIVVTSRPYAYEDWRLDDFGQVTLAALDEDRLEELSLRLFRVVLGQEGAEQEAKHFQEQIQKVPDELRSTPLFFSLMAAIWLDNHTQPVSERLPLDKGEIYRASVDMLVRRWTEKDLSGSSLIERIGLSEQQLRDVLELLAYRVHRGTRGDDDAVFEGGEIFNVVMELRVGRIDPFELLDALAQRAGVIYAKAANRFQFAHRSFQEHLSASYMTRPDQFPQRIVTHAEENSDLWVNVFDLVPGELNNDRLWKLIKALLPDPKALLPTIADDVIWSKIAIAARWMYARNLPEDDDLREIWQPRLAKMLIGLIEVGALDVITRAEMGRILGSQSDWDTRKGVGVDANGLPDMYKTWQPLPAGEYTIGGDDEAWEPLPKTTFTVPEGVYVAQYLVTYRQFEAFVQSPEFKDTQDPCWEGIPENQRGQACIGEQNNKHWNHPRENVSWYGAVAYSRWLTAKYRDAGVIRSDQMLTLPHDYLWEAAARGKTGKFYPYGNELNANKANIGDTGIGQTSAVGIFPEGRADCGALDMQGNVWEWALNPHGDVNSIGIANSAARSLRGAAFYDLDAVGLRAAARDYDAPDDRLDLRGCRLFLVPINKALSSGALDSVLW